MHILRTIWRWTVQDPASSGPRTTDDWLLVCNISILFGAAMALVAFVVGAVVG